MTHIEMASEQKARESIIYAADFSPAYSGNFIASLKAAAAECRARGLRIVWVFPDKVRDFAWFRELAAESGASAYLLSREDNALTNGWKLARIAAAENAVILHTHFSFFDVSAWVAKTLCALRLRRIRVLWHVHSAFPSEPSWTRRLKDRIKLGLLGRGCTMVPVSGALGVSVMERGSPRSRIRVIANGIDMDHATQREGSREDLRKQLGIQGHTWMLLGFGWTPLRKGVDTMLGALSILAEGGLDAILVVVGTAELRQFIHDWPDQAHKSRVRVIEPLEHVADLLGAAEIFLSPSRAEGWPYSVAEAMVNGVPVALSDIPAVDWAKQAPGVYFSNPGDAQGLAQSVLRIVNTPENQRRQTAVLARCFIQDRHTVQKWGEDVWRLYEELLSGPERHPEGTVGVTHL